MLLGMTLLLLSSAASGAEKQPRKVVRVPAVHYDRMMILDENKNPISGYAYDYINLIGTYSRWDIEYVPCESFSDSVKKLIAGEVDLYYDVSYTAERAKVILFPERTMGNEYYYLYALDGNNSIVPAITTP